MLGSANDAILYDRARVERLDYCPEDRQYVTEKHSSILGYHRVRTVLWFLPIFSVPYGGVHTIFRIARRWRKSKQVKNIFVFCTHRGSLDETIVQAVGSLYPECSRDEIKVWDGRRQLDVPPADISIATFWETAFFSIRHRDVKRYFYLIQDHEPSFYPASTSSALAASTYDLGFYAMANTPGVYWSYKTEHRGIATYFDPSVDPVIFNPGTRLVGGKNSPPWKIFLYGRPGAQRNAFGLCIESLRMLKDDLGSNIAIVSAGANWNPADFQLSGIVENLGILTVEETGTLYRECDIGLCLSLTHHCSYIPLELMACGCPVVTNRNSWTEWLLKDGETCFSVIPTRSCIKSYIEHALNTPSLRKGVASQALHIIRNGYSDWDSTIDKLFLFICNPIPTSNLMGVPPALPGWQ